MAIVIQGAFPVENGRKWAVFEHESMKITRLSARKSQSLGTIAKSLLSVVLAAGLRTSSFAQEESATGIISGSIQDADYGGSVLGAKVTLVKNQMSAKTNTDGRYFMTDPTMTLNKSRFDGNPADLIATVDNWDSGGAESSAQIVAAAAFAGLPPFLFTNDFQRNVLPTDDTTSTAALVTLT